MSNTFHVKFVTLQATTTENTKTNTENMCAKDLKKARKGKKRGKTACAKKVRKLSRSYFHNNIKTRENGINEKVSSEITPK